MWGKRALSWSEFKAQLDAAGIVETDTIEVIDLGWPREGEALEIVRHADESFTVYTCGY